MVIFHSISYVAVYQRIFTPFQPSSPKNFPQKNNYSSVGMITFPKLSGKGNKNCNRNMVQKIFPTSYGIDSHGSHSFLPRHGLGAEVALPSQGHWTPRRWSVGSSGSGWASLNHGWFSMGKRWGKIWDK